jgi:plasmid stabilization system protein ParE
MKIIWSPRAIRDLERAYNFYVEKNERAAEDIFNSILNEIKILSVAPHIAQKEPLLSREPETYRSLVVVSGRFKIIYYIESDNIIITHVWDCRQNPVNLDRRPFYKR